MVRAEPRAAAGERGLEQRDRGRMAIPQREQPAELELAQDGVAVLWPGELHLLLDHAAQLALGFSAVIQHAGLEGEIGARVQREQRIRALHARQPLDETTVLLVRLLMPSDAAQARREIAGRLQRERMILAV